MATLMINKIKSNETISIPLTTTEPNSACMAFTDGETTYYAQLVPKGDVYDSGIYTIRQLNGSTSTNARFALSTKLFSIVTHDYNGNGNFQLIDSTAYNIEKPTIEKMKSTSYLIMRASSSPRMRLMKMNNASLTLKGNAVNGSKEGFYLDTYVILSSAVNYTGDIVDIGEWFCSSSKYIRIRKNKNNYLQLIVNGATVCTSTNTIIGSAQRLIVAAYNNECYIQLGSTKTSVVTKKLSAGDYEFWLGITDVSFSNSSIYDFGGNAFYQYIKMTYCSDGTHKTSYINLCYT